MLQPRKCTACGVEFKPYRWTQKCCSGDCGRAITDEKLGLAISVRYTEEVVHTCVICNTSFRAIHTHHKYCSPSCRLVAIKQNRYKQQVRKQAIASEGEYVTPQLLLPGESVGLTGKANT